MVSLSASHVRRELAPCEECRLRAQCAVEQLACAAYALYAAAAPRRQWLTSARTPTREQFLALAEPKACV